MGAARGPTPRTLRRCRTSATSNDDSGGLVEGLFSKTFRSGLQPVEIAKRIVRTMDERKQVGVNEVWAPNRFEVSLSERRRPAVHSDRDAAGHGARSPRP